MLIMNKRIITFAMIKINFQHFSILFFFSLLLIKAIEQRISTPLPSVKRNDSNNSYQLSFQVLNEGIT